ncbi:MAG TPA: tetratricopeptide repeat protein, partial [Candidatus Binataceae bacterium]
MTREQLQELTEASKLTGECSELYRSGKSGEAITPARRALAIREEVLGPKHLDTAASLNNLAALLQDRGDYPASRLFLQKALAIHEEVLGPKHPETASSLHHLASAVSDQGDYAAAKSLYGRALAIRKEVLGEAHSDYTSTLNRLADTLGELSHSHAEREDFAAATTASREAVAILMNHYGESHWKVTDARLALGFVERRAGMTREQRQRIADAYRLDREVSDLN